MAAISLIASKYERIIFDLIKINHCTKWYKHICIGVFFYFLLIFNTILVLLYLYKLIYTKCNICIMYL